MTPRTTTALIVTVTFLVWMGSRATAIALPLIALQQTGEAWTTGLVLGAQSLPLLTVGWWGAALRERMTTCRAIGAVMGVEVLGLAIVPVSAMTTGVGVGALIACGLVVGATTALVAPAVRSVLSDLGDAIGPGRAARALTFQDLAHRCTMFLAPPLGALAVGHGHATELLWAQCGAVAVGAVILAALPAPSHAAAVTVGPVDAGRPRIEIAALLRAHPRMTASMAVHTTVTLTWFAFSLGLAIAGAQTGRPGVVVAAGMTGYGITSTLTGLAAPLIVNRVAAWPTAVVPCAILGVAFVVLSAHLDSVMAVTLISAAGGAAMPVAIGAHNRILATVPPPGPARRAAFTVDHVLDGGAAAIGMLGGGAVVGIAGVGPTLLGAGIVQIAVAAVSLLAPPDGETPGRPGERADVENGSTASVS